MAENIQSTIKGYFDNWTWAKGKRYFEEGRVSEWALKDHAAHAEIKGSGDNRYSSTIYFSPDHSKLVDSDCTCPMVLDCKHTAALALAYIKSLNEEDIQVEVRTEKQKRTAAALRAAPIAKKTKVPAKSKNLSVAESIDEESEYKPGKTKPEPIEPNPKPVKLPSLRPATAETLQYIEDCEANNASVPMLDQSGRNKTGSTLIYRLSDTAGLSVNLFKAKFQTAKSSTEDKEAISFDELKEVDFYSLFESEFRPRYVPQEDENLLFLLNRVLTDHSYFARQVVVTSEPELFDLVLRRLVETERCYWMAVGGQPLKYGPSLELKPVWITENEHYKLALNAPDLETPLPLQTIAPLNWPFPYYINRTENIIGKCKSEVPADILGAFARLPKFSKDELLAFLVSAAQRRVLHRLPPPPEDCRFEVRTIAPQANLELKQIKTKGAFTVGRRFVDRNENIDVFLAELDQGEDARLFRDDDGKIILEVKDYSRPSAMQVLRDSGFEPIPKPTLNLERRDNHKMAFLGPSANRLMELATDDFKPLTDCGWQISPAMRESLRPQPFTENHLTVGLGEDSEWWFKLELKLTIDKKEHDLLPIMHAALEDLRRQDSGVQWGISDEAIETLNRRGLFIATLENGQVISLPFDRARAILHAMRDVFELEEGPSLAIDRVHDLLNYEGLAMARWFGADRARTLIERLRNFINQQAQAPAFEPPKQLQATLRPYQMEGLKWMQNLAANKFGGVLADDMGLGKTIQLLAHIALEKENGRLKHPFLVVCPKTVLPNWLSEAHKFTPHLKVTTYAGSDRKEGLATLKEYDIVVTSYPIVFRDKELQEINWHGMALDEAQAIKTPGIKLSQIVCKYKAEQRFCMTGTPIENNLGELWSLFRFVLPGLLGSKTYFSKYVRSPIEKHGDMLLKEILARRVEPFMLRRTKAEVLQDLPPKTTIIKTVELQGNQRDIYETVRLAAYDRIRREIASRGFKMSQIIILDAMLKLRQTCCDPQIVKIDEVQKIKESAKRDVLFEMLDEIVREGRKVIVFSQFTSFLDIVIAHLNDAGIPFVEIRGSTKDRVAPVKEFQEGQTQIFLLSLKAGGTGLNLTAADTVIHYDPWWNPAVEDQATDRAHRIGQDKPVFVYKLIAQGTIEERMMELQERKRDLTRGIVDKDGHTTEVFTEADLERLLEPITSLDWQV